MVDFDSYNGVYGYFAAFWGQSLPRTLDIIRLPLLFFLIEYSVFLLVLLIKHTNHSVVFFYFYPCEES